MCFFGRWPIMMAGCTAKTTSNSTTSVGCSTSTLPHNLLWFSTADKSNVFPAPNSWLIKPNHPAYVHLWMWIVARGKTWILRTEDGSFHIIIMGNESSHEHVWVISKLLHRLAQFRSSASLSRSTTSISCFSGHPSNDGCASSFLTVRIQGKTTRTSRPCRLE